MNVADTMTRPEVLTGERIRPRNDNLVLRVLSRTEQEGHEGLILLPELDRTGKAEDVARQTMWCAVVDVGPDVYGIAAGDEVLVGALAGEQVWIGDAEHRIVRMDACLAAR